MPYLTRRDAFRFGAAATVAGAAGIGLTAPVQADSHTEFSDTTLWYTAPAVEWTEALPIGNGRLGAMVFGGVNQERLQLNEDTLWAGSPYQPAHKGAVNHLKEVRDLIFAGKYTDAEALIDKEMMATPSRQMSYQTIGNLLLTTGVSSMAGGYRRSLDLDTAVTTTTYSQDGVNYRRETFATPIDQVVALRITADRPASVNLHASFETPQKAASLFDGGDLILRGVNTAQQGIDGKVRFETRVRFLTTGGTRTEGDNELVIKGADSVVVLISAATNFKRYDDLSGDPVAQARMWLDAAAPKPFKALKAAHIAEHQRLFRRVSLDLGRTAAADMPTDARIAKSPTQADPALAMLYYQYGRYLMISTSRPGTQAAGLQGVWNDKLNAPWGGKYTININTEMNYWPAEPGNLAECVDPLVDLVREIAVTGQVTAREHYGARGWVCHHNTDIWRATGPIDAAKYGTWPMGGAWLLQHLYDRYEFNQDTAYLASIYPLMKGSCQFYLDALVKEPTHGWMVTCPSMSPEHTHPYGTMICAGPAMDTQILRDLFDKTVKAAAILKTDKAFAKQVAAMRAKLAPDQVGAEGQLQEWLEDWDMTAVDLHHRHVSHLYGVFPSHQMNIHDTPALTAAARKSLEIRGDQATGWGTAWRINLWARLGEGDHAHSILAFLLGPERTYPNMFDAHPPFQIDGNFGGANAVMEMLLQSWDDHLMPLPALPTDWPTGSVSGLRARGGLSVDLAWADRKLTRLTITSLKTKTLTLRYQGTTLPLPLKAGKAVTLGWNGSALTPVVS